MIRKTYEIYETDIETEEEIVRVKNIKYLQDASKLRDAFSSRNKHKKTKRYYFREET